MALTPTEIIIAGNGTIYHAPELTPLPSYLTDALDPAFVDVGYTSEDGATFTDAKEVNRVRAWQSFYPVRTHITERSGTVAFTMLQWNEGNLILAYGGGGIIQPQPGQYRYEPPEPEELAVRALVIDFADGGRNFRFCAGRCFVVSDVEAQWSKAQEAGLAIELEILAPATGEKPWTLDSDDPAWTPAAS